MQQYPACISAADQGLVDEIRRAVIDSSHSLVLCGPEGAGKAVLLELTCAELERSQARVLRVGAPPGQCLELPEFVAQVAGATQDGPGDPLERAFDALTEPDASCNRVALIVDRAEALAPETVRYIQFACRSAPQLQLVLAGRPELEALLSGDEFTFLRCRLQHWLEMPFLSETDAARFVEHRLYLAGAPAGPMMQDAAIAALLRHGHGNPGRISAVLDQAIRSAAVSRQALPASRAGRAPGGPKRVRAGTLPWMLSGAGLAAMLALALVVRTPSPPRPTVPAVPEPTTAVASETPDRPQATIAATVVDDSQETEAARPVPTDTPGRQMQKSVSPSPPKRIRPAPSLVVLREPVPRSVRPAHDAGVTAVADSGTNGRRCRDIVLKAQLGEDPTDADTKFLRNGCQ